MTHTLSRIPFQKRKCSGLRATWSIITPYCSIFTFTYRSFLFQQKKNNKHCTLVRECIFLSLLHTIRIYYVTAVTRMHTHRGLVFPVCGMILILIYAKYPNSLSRNSQHNYLLNSHRSIYRILLPMRLATTVCDTFNIHK